MNEARKLFLRRLGGSFLVGTMFGSPLDVLCQLLVRRGDVDQVFPPVFGILAAWSVFFYFWNRLGQVRVEGFLKWLAIGTSIGIAAGAVLGAIIYPLFRTVLETTSTSSSANNDPDVDRGTGVFIGVFIGGLIGAIASALAHLLRKPERLIRKEVEPSEEGGGLLSPP